MLENKLLRTMGLSLFYVLQVLLLKLMKNSRPSDASYFWGHLMLLLSVFSKSFVNLMAFMGAHTVLALVKQCTPAAKAIPTPTHLTKVI